MPGVGGFWKEMMSVLRPKIQVGVGQTEPEREGVPGRGTSEARSRGEEIPHVGGGGGAGIRGEAQGWWKASH